MSALATRSVPPASDGLGLADLVAMAQRRWLLIVGCMLVAMALVGAYVFTQTPLYRATAQLLIDPQQLQVVGRDIVRQDSSPSIDFAIVDSQVMVIKSTTVLGQLVDKPVERKADAEPGQAGERLQGLNLLEDPYYAPRAATLDPVRRRSMVIAAVADSLIVRRVDNSLVFEITVSHPDPMRASAIANRLAELYLQQVNTDRAQAVERARASLHSQIALTSGKLKDLETAVEAYKASNGLISTGDTGLIVSQQLKDLYTQISLAQGEVSRLASRAREAKAVGSGSLNVENLPEALTSPSMVALRGQYARIVQEEANLARTLGANHPQLRDIRAQAAATLSLITVELNRTRAAIEEDSRRAKENLAALQAQAKALTSTRITSGEAEIGLRQSESQAEAVRQVYNATLGRERELEQQLSIQTNNSRLFSAAAIPFRSIQPPKLLSIGAAGAFGAMLGLVVAFLMEMFGGAIARPAMLARFGKSRTAGQALPAAAAAHGWSPPASGLPMGQTAQRLQQRFGARLPATILLVSTDRHSPRPDLALELAEALVSLGEICLIYTLTVPGQPPLVRRLGVPRPLPPAPAVHQPRVDPLENWPPEPGQRTLRLIPPRPAPRPPAPSLPVQGEFVLIDALAAVPQDILANAGLADTALLVATAGAATRRDADALVEDLAGTGVPIFGTMLSGTRRGQAAPLPTAA